MALCWKCLLRSHGTKDLFTFNREHLSIQNYFQNMIMVIYITFNLQACAETFMGVSGSCSRSIRYEQLSPLFVNLLCDKSRWVSTS